MFDFGDELTVESNRISWLIWVQVLVMLLLILLLYCFTIISLDPTHNKDSSSSSSSPPYSSSQHVSNFNTHIASTVVTNRLQNTQVGESRSIKGEVAAGTNRRVVVRRGEDINAGREDQFPSGVHIYFHPCYYVRLARTAFLKCLGLDSASESSSNQQRKKKEQ